MDTLGRTLTIYVLGETPRGIIKPACKTGTQQVDRGDKKLPRTLKNRYKYMGLSVIKEWVGHNVLNHYA